MLGQLVRSLRGFRHAARHRVAQGAVSYSDAISVRGEALEERRLLAVAPFDLSQLDISVQADPDGGGISSVTFRRTDSSAAPMRLELRNTPSGVGFRIDTTQPFEVDLDPNTPGVQSVQQISTILLIGSNADDTFSLDETAGPIARSMSIDGRTGSNRLEHRLQDVATATQLIDLNLASGRIELTTDGRALARLTRSIQAHDVGDFAFYGLKERPNAGLIVRTGSGYADRVDWELGRIEVGLGMPLSRAASTRVTYTNFGTLWLFTAGGADTVTLRDLDRNYDDPPQAFTRSGHKLFVGTQDENDLLRINLATDNSLMSMQLDGGAGDHNRLEMQSYTGYGENFLVQGEAIHLRNQPGRVPVAIAFPGRHFDDPFVDHHRYFYDDIQQLFLGAGGGNDTIEVDQRLADTFPAQVWIEGEDDNDSVEINSAAGLAPTETNVDGGAGTNGLSQFIRPSISTNTPLLDENLNASSYVQLFGNEIRLDYFTRDRRTMGPASLPPDESMRDALTRFRSLAGVTIVTLEDGNVDLNAASTDASIFSIQMLVRSSLDTTNVTLGGSASDKHVRIDTNGQPQNLLLITSQNGDETVRFTNNRATFSSSGGSRSTLEFANYFQVNVETGLGADSVLVEQSAAWEFPKGLHVSTGDGDDSITYLLQEPAPLRTKLSIDGGTGSRDIFTLHDAPGNNLDLRLDLDFYHQFIDLAVDKVEHLRFFGDDGDDQFQNGTGIPSLLDGGAGNDTLFGGFAGDVLYGGDGLDQLWGRDGRDALYPDYDATGLLFALSSDFAHGGKGDDLIVTRAVDQIIDNDGANQIQDFAPPEGFDGTGESLAECACLLDHSLAFNSQGQIASSGRGVFIGISAITILQPELESIPIFTLSPSDD